MQLNFERKRYTCRRVPNKHDEGLFWKSARPGHFFKHFWFTKKLFTSVQPFKLPPAISKQGTMKRDAHFASNIHMHWNKKKCLHKKRVQLPQDWFGTPTSWPPFLCFETLTWLRWRHVKTLYIICKTPHFDFKVICSSKLYKKLVSGVCKRKGSVQAVVFKLGQHFFVSPVWSLTRFAAWFWRGCEDVCRHEDSFRVTRQGEKCMHQPVSARFPKKACFFQPLFLQRTIHFVIIFQFGGERGKCETLLILNWTNIFFSQFFYFVNFSTINDHFPSHW